MLFCDCFSIFVSTPATRQQLLKSFQIPVLGTQAQARELCCFTTFFPHLVHAHERASLQQTHAHFPFCRRGDVMLFQRGKRRSERRQRAVTCVAAALTHFSQVERGFPAVGGAKETKWQNHHASVKASGCIIRTVAVGKPAVCLLLCWPITAVGFCQNRWTTCISVLFSVKTDHYPSKISFEFFFTSHL